MDPQTDISHDTRLKETLIGFLHANQEAFLQQAGSKSMADNVTGIHQLRVATKRLRSVFRWMEWVAPQHFSAKHELRDVRKFFKVAGGLRELQLRERMLDVFCDRLGLTFSRYASILREGKWEAKQKLSKRLPKFDAKSLTTGIGNLIDLLETMSESELMESAIALVRHRMEEIKLLLPPGEDSDRYHKIRILLKENLYVMQQVNGAAPQPYFDLGWVEMVKDAGEKGGDWHDLDVFLLDLIEAHGRSLFPDASAFMALRDAVMVEERKAFKKYRKQVDKVLAASPFV